MPKLENIIIVRECAHPGRVLLDFAADPDLVAAVRRYPGAEYDRTENGYLFPEECLQFLPYAQRDVRGPRAFLNAAFDSRLYPFQVEAAQFALTKYSALLSKEMGLGKTGDAIAVMKAAQTQIALIVCPAMVRTTWEDELKFWWPEHPVVTACETGEIAKTAAAAPSGLVIVSYNMLHHFSRSSGFEVIVLDESSNIKSSNDKFSNKGKLTKKTKVETFARAAYSVCTRNPNARKLLLTGTPIDTEVKDLHNQLDCMHPGRWGNFWAFARAYCIYEEGKYGPKVYGVNKERAEELAIRLRAVSFRRTKREVQHLLPKSRMQVIRVKSKLRFNSRELSELLGSGNRKQHDLQAHVETCGSAKDETVTSLVQSARASGEKNILIATHLRSSAERLAQVLEHAGEACVIVDGERLPNAKKRKAAIRDATAVGAIVVATMHSIGIGINELAQYTTGILAELYWRPLVISQLIARLNRLSSKLPSVWYVPVVEGSLDEPIVSVLKRRMKDQEAVYEPGVSEEALTSSFEAADENWAAELSGALDVKVESVYL